MDGYLYLYIYLYLTGELKLVVLLCGICHGLYKEPLCNFYMYLKLKLVHEGVQ